MSGGLSFNYGKIKSQLNKIGSTFLTNQLRPEMMSKMKKVVSMMYETARTPRPMARNLLGRKGPKISSVGARFGVPVQTGNLRNSIQKEIKESGNRIAGRVFVDMKKAPYAKRVEYGFIGKDSAGRMYHQLPRPFIRPAYDKNIKQIERIFKEHD
jgi:HK97 gp10 family phage protein